MGEEERRQFKRVIANVGTAILSFKNEMFLGKGKIVDISVSGARLETGVKLEVGDKVILNFILNKGGYISETGFTLTGKVETIWKKQDEKKSVNLYGLKFIEISPVEKERIRDFVNFKLKEKESFI